jgi:hypothetical protein
MKNLHILSFPIATYFLLTNLSCTKTNPVNNKIKTDTAVTAKTIITLPERQVKVYIGISDRWHEMADPANYNSWSYVRSNAAGFYTNFIAMWVNKYQNTEDPQQSCNDMHKAFVKNGCFFETSLETQVNTGPDGANNESTDKQSIDMLNNSGFVVENTSLNYGVNAGRVNTLRTYNGTRNCFALEGSWLIGGNVNDDATAGNSQIRQDILSTNGVETDGPLGLWIGDSGSMQEGSYSLAKFAATNKRLSAIMLAPADGGVTTYHAATQFFSTAKACVLGHEDHNASPDMWTIWTYGENADEPTFPESVVNTNGQTAPANTLVGVGYWLLKHLNNQPLVQVRDTGIISNSVTVKATDQSNVQLIFNKAAGSNVSYSMPLIISNSNDPQIEISPVIRAVISGASSDWSVTFSLGGIDVTDDVIYNGGLNCINTMRITNTNTLTLIMNIKAKNTASAVNIKIETMSNISNTKNIADYTIAAKIQ